MEEELIWADSSEAFDPYDADEELFYCILNGVSEPPIDWMATPL